MTIWKDKGIINKRSKKLDYNQNFKLQKISLNTIL